MLPSGELFAMICEEFIEALRTTTPWRRTSSGKRGTAACTRLFTLIASHVRIGADRERHRRSSAYRRPS